MLHDFTIHFAKTLGKTQLLKIPGKALKATNCWAYHPGHTGLHDLPTP